MIITRNFEINTPYLYLDEQSKYKECIIYCDGSFVRFGHESFCCVGGIILSSETKEKIGEFFAPVSTKNQLNQYIVPNFEKIAINTALLISDKYNLKTLEIFNDNLSEVSKYKKINNKIKWIPRENNLADYVCNYAKNVWKNLNNNCINSYKFRNSLFVNKYQEDFFIGSFSYGGFYYYLAFHNDDIIDCIKFYQPNDFG